MVFICTLMCGIMTQAKEKDTDAGLPDLLKKEVIESGEWIKNEDGSLSFILEKNIVSPLRNSTDNMQVNYTLIPLTDEAKENLEKIFLAERSGGNKELTDSDAAGCLTAYSIINWKDISVNERDYVYLTSVSGGYSAAGSGSYISSGVSVSEQYINIGQSGFTTGGAKSQAISCDLDTKERSYSYDSSDWPEWLPVESTSGSSVMGTYYVITLKRGTDEWSCIISNNY